MNPSRHTILTYRIHDVLPYINWIYFFHAWGFQPRFAAIARIHRCPACHASWIASFCHDERAKATEALHLFNEAHRMLASLDNDFNVQTIHRLCPAYSDGDNLILDGMLFPLLRQQSPQPCNAPFLCLSDFVRPRSKGVEDCVGVFAASCSRDMEMLFADDPYKRMLVHTLADRLAEAATEKMHLYVRKVSWGYASAENLSIDDMLKEKFQGIRPAVGYPSLPDQSVIFLLNQLLPMSDIGISLTEHGAMLPHASVSGLMISHPASRYFSVGKIGEDQLVDYAQRRGLPIEEVRRFLARNL